MGEPWCRYLHNVGIIVGCVCFISLTATCLERGLCRVSGFLAGSSFFVYAYHGMPLALAIKVVVRGDRLVFGICLCGDRDRTRFVWRDEAVCPFLFIADYWWTIVLITKMACLRNSLIRGFLLGMGAFR